MAMLVYRSVQETLHFLGTKPKPLVNPMKVFDGLEGVSVGGFTDDYFERTWAAV